MTSASWPAAEEFSQGDAQGRLATGETSCWCTMAVTSLHVSRAHGRAQRWPATCWGVTGYAL